MIVYIAHPIAADIIGNAYKVKKILKHIFKTWTDILPVAPYLAAVEHLEENEKNRARAFELNKRFFSKKVIDELWVCGFESPGVKLEIEWAKLMDIPVKHKDFNYLFEGM